MTNYERIKSMTVEDMANAIVKDARISFCGFCTYGNDLCPDAPCESGIKEWLESEVSE